MQKRFLTLAFIGLLSTSTFAASDLLSQATDGAVTTAKAETTEVKALSNDEMKDVKGGTLYSSIYASSFRSPTSSSLANVARYVRVRGW